jgi:ankyrin repeat protein
MSAKNSAPPIANPTGLAAALPPSAPAAPEAPEIDYKAALERLLTPAVLAGGSGEPLLMSAARAGDVDLVRVLAPKSNRLASSDSMAGYIPLCAAAAGGHAECVKVLLERQAAEQCASRLSWNKGELRPLDHAIRGGRWDCVRLLVPHTDLRDSGSSSSRQLDPFVEAARHGRLDILRFLTPFLFGAETPDPARDPALIERAIESAASGRSPGATECLKHLAALPQARVVPETPSGGWPQGGALFKAIEADSEANVLFLLPFFGASTCREGQESDPENNRAWSPLRWAIQKRSVRTVVALLPVCEAELLRADPASEKEGRRVSETLSFALQLVASRMRWHRDDAEGIAKAWEIVDAIGSRWTQMSGLEGRPASTDDAMTKWVAKADLSDPQWKLAPRWRASLEASMLVCAIARPAAPAIQPKAEEPEPASRAVAAAPHKSPRI